MFLRLSCALIGPRPGPFSASSFYAAARAPSKGRLGFYLDRPFKPTTFLVVQPDGDRIFDVADEFERNVVIVAENFMSKRFI